MTEGTSRAAAGMRWGPQRRGQTREFRRAKGRLTNKKRRRGSPKRELAALWALPRVKRGETAVRQPKGTEKGEKKVDRPKGKNFQKNWKCVRTGKKIVNQDRKQRNGKSSIRFGANVKRRQSSRKKKGRGEKGWGGR